MARIGRPTKLTDEVISKVGALCDLGATDEEIAAFFDVSARTIHRWKLDEPAFCHALKAGKENADNRVERSLYQRATGFYYTEQVAIKIKVSQYEEEVKIVDVEKYATPDTTANIFWLKNRKSDSYRDRVEHTGKDGEPLIPIPINLAKV